MKKRHNLIALLLSVIFIISGCSSADADVVIVDEETGEEIKVSREEVEQKENEVTAYSEHLSSTFETSISLQDTFAHALDAMFTKESTASQFAKILKDNVIDSSRDILDTVEKYNFPSDYFEMNQMVVTNLNNQHQLFLDAVNEAVNVSELEGSELDIVKLRERLADIKQEYLTIVNVWKNGGVVS